MTELDILLPFGLPPAELSADLLKELNTPALSLLTSRAASGNIAHETVEDFQPALPHERWLADRFGLGKAMEKCGGPPIAQALMQTMGIEPLPSTWFVLQPVHIHIARDHLVLTDPRQLALSESEARILFEIAAPLFDESGKRLLFGNTSTWFVDAGDWTSLRTSTPDAACGHNIDIWMPKGPEERAWRKVQNEVQMHWFNHPVNEEREARRQRPVNSLWLWGGPSDLSTQVSGNYDKAFNLCGWMQAFRHGVPQHSGARTASDMIPSLGVRNMLLLDAPLEPALANDWARWLDAMKHMEEEWLAPVLQALRSGAIDRVSLIITHDTRISRFAATRSSLRKFWIKPSLAPLCP